jgi:hypothetical protein
MEAIMRLPKALVAAAVVASMLSGCGNPYYGPEYAYSTDAYSYGYRYPSGYNYFPTGYYAPRDGYYPTGYYTPRFGYYRAPAYYYSDYRTRGPHMTIAAAF